MSSSARFRRIAAVSALAVAALIAAGFAPWRISATTRDSMLERISLALNASMLRAEGPHFTLLPSPRVTMSAMNLETHAGYLKGRAERLTIHLDWISLLAGRLKASGIALGDPDLKISLPTLGAAGFRDVGGIADLFAETLAARVRAALPSRIDIDNGRLTIDRSAGGSAQIYEDVRLRLRAPGLRHPVSVSFRGRQGTDETRFTFLGATPLRVATGGREPISFAWSTPNASLSFEGEGIVSGNLMLNGAFTASANGAPGAWFSARHGRDSAFSGARVSLKSTLDFSARGANLSDLRLTLNNDRFEGVGSIRHDGQRWTISGTLATEHADVTPFLEPLRTSVAPDGGWSAAPVEIDALFAHNVDIRLSADRLVAFGKPMEKTAIAILSRANKAELTIGDALWQKGGVKFRLAASPGSFGLDLKLTGALDRVDAALALADLGVPRRLSGQASVNLAIDTSGGTMAQFVANAEGRIAAMLRNGEIFGIDMNRLAGRRDTRRELALAEALGGRTPFESASLSVKIANGATQAVDGHMRAGRIVGTLQGSIDFAGASHDLAGHVVQTPADPQGSEPSPLLEFRVTGPLFEPSVSPNMGFLLRRS